MKVVFLDRDGVINRDYGYVHRLENFEFMPGAIEGMSQLSKIGFKLIVVTNQSGIARGFYDEATFFSLTNWMRDELSLHHIHLLDIYFCPHHPEGVVEGYARICDCRKPAPGMLLRARADHGIDMPASVMMGDKPSDVEAARAAGVGSAFLISRAGSALEMHSSVLADAVLPDLEACANFIQKTIP